MIYNTNCYVDYSKLSDLVTTAKNCFNNDKNDWLSIKDLIPNLRDDPELDGIDRIDWHYVNIYPPHESNMHPVVEAKIQPIITYATSMLGVERVVLIFNGPNTIIPEHDDVEDADDHGNIHFYRIVMGIFVPSYDPNLVSITTDNTSVPDIDMFLHDARQLHSGFNNTQDWWIQLILCINKQYVKI
jgi:hypothetical protein